MSYGVLYDHFGGSGHFWQLFSRLNGHTLFWIFLYYIMEQSRLQSDGNRRWTNFDLKRISVTKLII